VKSHLLIDAAPCQSDQDHTGNGSRGIEHEPGRGSDQTLPGPLRVSVLALDTLGFPAKQIIPGYAAGSRSSRR
jgi:hypothetical protein